MRVFICSTAHDLADARDLCAEALRAAGHEAVHHENAGFPQFSQVHSHDRCILAVRDCNALVCIVDRRYGGKYAGQLRSSTPPIVISRARGSTTTLQVGDLSISWMEVLEARALGIPVMTFARQKTLDERELRKRNHRLKSLKMVHVADGHYGVFDFLDWTTHEPRDNWIEKFVTLTELRDRILAWVNSLRLATSSPVRAGEAETQTGLVPSAAVFVEGGFDGLLVKGIIDALQLRLRVDVIPVGGKALLLGNLQATFAVYANKYEAVVFLADADTDDAAAAAAELARIRELLQHEGLEQRRAFVCLAIPSTSAWLEAMGTPGTDGGSEKPPRAIWKEGAIQPADLQRAIARAPSLREFVDILRGCARREAQEPSREEIATRLLLRAKQAIAEGRKHSASSLLQIEFDLESEREIEGALLLEERGQAHVISEDGRWRFSYFENHSWPR